MISWLDHLTALVVLPVLLMILVVVQQTSQTSSTDALVRTTGRTMLTDAAAWIERDLANVGAGVPASEQAIEAYAWSGTTPTATFRTMPDTSASATVERVTYERQTVGNRYRLVRYVTTSSGRRISGQTPATLRSVSLTLLNAAGAPVTASSAFGTVRMIEIAITMDPPLGGTPVPLMWSHRFTPPNLAATRA